MIKSIFLKNVFSLAIGASLTGPIASKANLPRATLSLPFNPPTAEETAARNVSRQLSLFISIVV